MSLFVTYHIDFTIVLFCRASIMHSTPSLSMLFSDNLNQGIKETRKSGVILCSIHSELKLQIKYWANTNTVFFSLHTQIFSTTHQSSSSDALFLMMLARAQAPALPILLATKLL